MAKKITLTKRYVPKLDESVGGGGAFIFTSTSVGGASTLSGLGDVTVLDISTYDVVQYDETDAKWINRQPINIVDYFYTKDEIDAKLALIAGGNY